MATGEFVPFNPDRWRRYPQSAKVGWITDENGCDIWQGAKHHWGYGLVYFQGRQVVAHRARYIREVGPIPDGLVLDHYICDNGAGGCCNPHHCRPVEQRENVLRSDNFSSWKRSKTRCPKGHELAGDNLLPWHLRHGRRKCRTCANERKARKGRERYTNDPAFRERTLERTGRYTRERHSAVK